MKLLGIAAAVLAVVAPAFAYTKTYSLTYDTLYDNDHASLIGANVTCSHGEHGLLTHGYPTFDSIPYYPYIGAAPQISGTESKYCGSCWEIRYTDPHGTSTSVNFTAIDASKYGPETFTISLQGMNYLTHGLARKLASVPITATRKHPKACNLG